MQYTFIGRAMFIEIKDAPLKRCSLKVFATPFPYCVL